MENSHLSDVAFSSLGLHETLIKALNEAGFDYCTPIQAQTLPVALAGKDVAGQAQTGTGKTAAFLLATLHYLMSNPVSPKREGPWALILAPTRELAIQIHKDAEQLGKHTGMYFSAVYGGTGYESQRKELETGTDIIIGTPGRVIDFFKQGVFHLKDIEVMILDEADRMFDLGFIDDIRYLLRRMPPPERRINMLYSATLSHRVMELAYEHMNDPTVIKVEAEQVTADRVQQRLYHVANDEKIPLLIGLVKQEHLSRTIVFVNTKRGAELVHRYLEGNGFQAAVLSGDIPQRKREQLLGKFQAGELSILVATDVAARGLHIPDVSHVINFDLPDNAEDYVHRIGRTARAGASGDAISFACESYVYSLPDIEAYIEQKIPSEATPRELLVTPEPPTPAPPRKPRSGGPRRGAPRGRDNRPRSNRS